MVSRAPAGKNTGVSLRLTQSRACLNRLGAAVRQQYHCWVYPYLCDFYHVSEYLSAAAGAPREWLHWAQRRLKENAVEEVLADLRPRREPVQVADEAAPVRRCVRYLENRRTQLDYAGALAAGLPIGSGEIESGHRSVFEERLKLSGAWWKQENAQKMVALRVTRAEWGVGKLLAATGDVAAGF